MSQSPLIIRRRTGNFLEDFEPGRVFRHKGGKTVTEGLFATFTEFAMTANPLAKSLLSRRQTWSSVVVVPQVWRQRLLQLVRERSLG